LTLRADSVVEGLDYDPVAKRLTGVRVIDANTKEKTTYTAKLVFLCASTIGSTQVLQNSRSEAFPNGLANRRGVLGRYLMDHTSESGAFGVVPGFMDKYPLGHRPNGTYIPRFRNLKDQDADLDFVRGYGYQGGAQRMDWKAMSAQIPGFGARFKQALRTPGPWFMFLAGFGEHLPHKDSRMLLDEKQVDSYGIPRVKFDSVYRENEQNMRKDIAAQTEAMLKAAGAVNVNSFVSDVGPGTAIHEMGTARMGDNPAESVLSKWNQAYDVANLFVTDGACMTSSSCVNPSITYMALTARAADYAVKQLKSGHI
ncbi:MAG: GMC oxidoreductase, partial [Pseudomonadales bacterium]